MSDAIDRWTVGDVTITRVVEFEIGGFPPIQFTDPDICANFDFDQKVGLATRQTFINNHADRAVLILGTHFPTPAVGHIVRDGERWRFTPVNADVS